MKKTVWLDRSTCHPLPFYCLAQSEAEFHAALKHLKLPLHEYPRWGTSDATSHFLTNEKGGLCCIVALRNMKGRTPLEVYGLLVHEAVHIWQEYCDSIGEKKPSSEFEAYPIQWIAQQLIEQFMLASKKKTGV